MTTKAEVLHAIREKCLDCSCYQPGEVRRCVVTACALWPFRMGEDPAPSSQRGFAKTRVYTGHSAGRAGIDTPGRGRSTSVDKSPVTMGGHGEREPVPAEGVGCPVIVARSLAEA
jgi:hypothetical protein